MIPSVVVDTDVVSSIFKRDTRADLYRPYLDGKLTIISFMTVAEIDRWALAHKWGKARQCKMEYFLQDFLIFFCDRPLCSKWPEVTESARCNGHPIGTADTWVAATALLHGIPLVTHNCTHYAGVDGLTVISKTA